MKNKVLLFLMISAIFCCVFLGCGDGENTNTTEAATNVATDATNEATADVTTQAVNVVTNDIIPDIEEITFNEYSAMTAEEQKEIMDSFEEVEEYFDWYEEIVEEHKKNPETTEPGPIFPDVPDETVPQKNELTFLDYHMMSADEQKAFINSFESINAFVEWHKAAKKAYDESLIPYDGTTPIDLNDVHRED